MRLTLYRLVIWFFLFCPLSVLAMLAGADEANDNPLLARVSEASDYLNFKPETSLQIINGLEDELLSADKNLRLEAWLVGIWAGIYLSDKNIAKRFSEKIIFSLERADGEYDYNRMLIAIGVHLWRQREYEHAYLFAVCGLKHAQSPRELLRNLTLLGISSHQRDIDFAHRVYSRGLQLAKKYRQRQLVAVFTANLGAIAMLKSDYVNAEHYYSSALDMRYENNHMAGQLTAGTNLMLIYFMQKKWDYFVGLSQRMTIVLKNHPSEQYQNYYDWLMKAWQMQGQTALLEDDVKELVHFYKSINRASIQSVIRKAALTMNITLADVPEPSGEQGGQFLALFPVCDWQKYQTMSESQVLQEIAQL